MSRFFQKSGGSDIVHQTLNELKELRGKLDKLEAVKPSESGKKAHACLSRGIEAIHMLVTNTHSAEKISTQEEAAVEQKTLQIF